MKTETAKFIQKYFLSHLSLSAINELGKDHEKLFDAIEKNGFRNRIGTIQGKWHDSYFQDIVGIYVGRDDTYDTTLVFDCVTKRYYIMSMGDFVEWKNKSYEII